MAEKQQSPQSTKQEIEIHRHILKQMVTLATSAFGLVAALAWNDAIQRFTKEYIDRYLPATGGILSRFIYAIIITAIAVTITYQLSKLAERLDSKNGAQ